MSPEKSILASKAPDHIHSIFLFLTSVHSQMRGRVLCEQNVCVTQIRLSSSFCGYYSRFESHDESVASG